MRRLALPIILVLATCAHRPRDVAAPDRAAVLEVVTPDRLPTLSTLPAIAAERVLTGDRGAYVLSAGGLFAAAFPDGPRGEAAVGDGAPASSASTMTTASWVDAVEIDALEGGGRWTLGLSGAGTIHRLRGGGGLEPMNGRLGVPARARHMHAAGSALAVLADDGLFVVTTTRVTRFDLHGRGLAASRSAAAILSEDAVHCVDLETKRTRSFSVEDPRAVALTAGGVLVVATESAIYRENGSGELSLRYLADDAVGALATEGEHVWFADGSRLGVLDEKGVKLTGDMGAGPITQIAPTAGDVWIVEASRARRLTRAGDGFPPDVERIARSVCVPCHQPTRVEGGGPFDLSAAPAFRAHRADVIRALTTREMPPRGRALSDADRARLVEWTRTR